MSSTSAATVSILTMIVSTACVAEVDSYREADDHEPEVVAIAAGENDSFACFRPESASSTNGGYSCAGSPSLTFSTLCREGTNASYHVIYAPTGREMTMGVIAPHGGAIEPNTDDIALGLAEELGLPHYVFVAHASDSCLDKYGGARRSNHRALHITSTHFNDRRAEDLMRSVNRGVSVHGHGGPNKVCVGGATRALRDAFIRYYIRYTARHSPSDAIAVNAPNDDDCEHIAGTSSLNISNRTRARAGLQLELSRTFREELVESRDGDRLLWNSFRNAVRAACRVEIGGSRGCGA